MSALTFTLKSPPPERLDLSVLAPHNLAGKERREIETLRIGRTKRASRVADVFRITGNDVSSLVFEGGDQRLDGIAHGMQEGSVRITGDVGAGAGRLMRGGTLFVDGNAGPHAGSGMRGGRIEIAGDAGDHLAGPLAGELAGMNGGVLIVRGRAGAFAADRMRRGLIAALGGAGDFAGSRMIAGTLVIAGETGALPGYLMRRGSIVLDRAPAALAPTFVECGSPDSVFAAILDRHLVSEGIFAEPFLGLAPRRYGGDNAVLGKGEVLFPR